jgi:hypothetical protein
MLVFNLIGVAGMIIPKLLFLWARGFEAQDFKKKTVACHAPSR